MTSMFSADFKKHVNIIGQLRQTLNTNPKSIVNIVDIIFKWCYIRLTESQNTTLALNVIDFLSDLFTYLLEGMDEVYELWDHEAFVIIPFLCEKSGAYNSAVIKDKMKQLIRLCFKLYEPKKVL